MHNTELQTAISKAEIEYQNLWLKQGHPEVNFINVKLSAPEDFQFDINEVLFYLKYTDIEHVVDESEINDIIDTCITRAIAGYDDVYYYCFGQDQYDFVRSEVKKHLQIQLNLGI